MSPAGRESFSKRILSPSTAERPKTMRRAIELRDSKLRAAAHLTASLDWIEARSKYKVAKLTAIRGEELVVLNKAACIINAGARGYFSRQKARALRTRYRAAKTCQRVIRGFIGRRRALRRKYEVLSIVPGTYSLQLMFEGSRWVQDRGDWREYLDLRTYRFWYYNRLRYYTTWEPPEEFKWDLVCTWDPVAYPWVNQKEPCCRQIFKNVNDFHTHRLKAHYWYCPACDYRNSSVFFPRCEACDNTLDPSGKDMVKELKAKLRRVMKEVWGDKMEEFKNRNSKKKKTKPKPSDTSANPGDSMMLSETELLAQDKARSHERQLRAGAEMGTFDLDQYYGLALNRHKSFEEAYPIIHGKPIWNAKTRDGPVNDEDVADMDELMMTGSLEKNAGMEGREGGMLTMGLTTTMDRLPLEARARVAAKNVVLPDGHMFVCNKFLDKECDSMLCPLAHPGVRDSAEQFKMPKKKGKRNVHVQVCHDFIQGNCQDGMACTKYHIYIRPPTKDIIAKIYPKRKGHGRTMYPSGAILDSNVTEGLADGHGTMTWPNDDVYMGEWLGGKRHGFGLYRSKEGKEYVGEWKDNMRDGLGVWIGSNGEMYEGQWKQGKMHGAGRLTSLNGDIYEGQFENHEYHGLGRFTKRGGDTYIGSTVKGEACGLGILCLSDGELYKGEFSKNQRHGKGVCVYGNGSRYAGGWHQGKHSGFGVFTCLNGERYMGHWHMGKKSGYGRYIFENGDIYDGDWLRDLAHGKGFYRYADNGSCYVGEWANDKKNGQGIYYTLKGSRYDGKFLDNSIHGRGSFYFAAQKARYTGQFRHNKKHGLGVYTWATGNRYKGEFREDKMDGFGEMLYVTAGCRYVGNFKNNKKNGQGTFYYADGNIYDGDFKDDIKHGHGKLIINPGLVTQQSYEGEWVNGEKQGKGTYRYRRSDGTVYEGTWVNNIRHGTGMLRFKDGSFYRGAFEKERFTGLGTFVSARGDQYEGDWMNNVRHGHGTQLYTDDGSIFSGQFVMGVRHGPGHVTYLNGNKYSGHFVMDNMRGVGSYLLNVGSGEKDKLKLKVFGY